MRRKRMIWATVMLIPAIAYFGFFVYYPLIQAFWLSLTDFNFFSIRTRFVGLENFVNLLQDPLFVRALRNTVTFALVTVGIGVPLSIVFAWSAQWFPKFESVIKAVYFIPTLAPGIVITLLWQWMYEPRLGLLNQFLRLFGQSPINWLLDVKWALFSIMLINIWALLGFRMIIVSAGLKSIPREYYEAAQIDGASRLAAFYYVTIPLLRPIILFLVVTGTLAAFQVFTEVFVLTYGGPADATRTVVFSIYETAFQFFRMGYGSAMAVVLFVLLILITLLQFRLSARWE